MRRRTIVPTFFSNELLAEYPERTRLTFIGLWCLADREGRLEDRPKRIAAELFPYDRQIDGAAVHEMLKVLAGGGFINRYGVDGKAYIQIPEFLKHQSPHPHEKKSVIPLPRNVITFNDNVLRDLQDLQDLPAGKPGRSSSVVNSLEQAGTAIDDDGLKRVSLAMRWHMGRGRRPIDDEPDDAIVIQTIRAAGGADPVAIEGFLIGDYKRRRNAANGGAWAEGWGFFPTIVKNHFQRTRNAGLQRAAGE